MASPLQEASSRPTEPPVAPSIATPDASPIAPDASGIEASRANLVAQQQRLMELLDERSKPSSLDWWSTMAGSLANSGKSGWDALAAAGVGTGLANKQQQAKELTGAQMRMEIANSILGQRERMYGMDVLKKSMNGDSGQEGVAPPETANTNTGGWQSITPKTMTLLQMYSPDLAKAVEAGLKIDQDRYLISQNGVVFDKRSSKYLNSPVPGQEQKDYSTPFGTFKMTPYDFSQFQLAQSKGAGREWLESYRSGNAAPSASAPTTAGTAGMQSEEQKKIIQTGSEERAKKDAEFSALTRSNIFSAADVAPRLSSLAQSNMQLIQDNPDAVGVLSGGGVGNAILGLLSKIRIGGQGAGADFDTSGIEEAIRKVGPTRLPNESNDVYEARRQRNIDASLQIVRNLAEMELNFAKSFMKGQGAVSNMERNITRALGGNISDSRTALMAKNDLLIITADADEKIRDAYVDWANKNPNKGAEYFKGSEEEKSIRNEYNAKVTALNARYFAPKQAAPANAQKDNSELRDRLRKQLGGQ